MRPKAALRGAGGAGAAEGRSTAASKQTRMARRRTATDSHTRMLTRRKVEDSEAPEAPAREPADMRDVERAARESRIRIRCAAGEFLSIYPFISI